MRATSADTGAELDDEEDTLIAADPLAVDPLAVDPLIADMV